MNLKSIGESMLLIGDVNIIEFKEYGHYSDVVLKPEDLCNPENDWITKNIHSNHLEIRNNLCTVHIGYFEKTEHEGISYSSYELEKLFWKDALHEEER